MSVECLRWHLMRQSQNCVGYECETCGQRAGYRELFGKQRSGFPARVLVDRLALEAAHGLSMVEDDGALSIVD